MGNFEKLYPIKDIGDEQKEVYTRIKELAADLFTNQFGVRKAKTTPIASGNSKMMQTSLDSMPAEGDTPDMKRD